ncbi:MAG: SMI1/KNR4 family protein [Planctomycetes bacterium]|nr:SMI1/KNR4 family protein [Planctomycetota bacterium]
MINSEKNFPALLEALHQLEFDYADGEGIDFEPSSNFLSQEETRSWIRAWTGNKELEGAEYRIFGQDGTGGYAAFWLVRSTDNVLEQPIVFLGSEGELGVVASNFSEYLWLLAGGIGPYEAISYRGLEREENPVFTSFAEQHSKSPRLGPWQVVAKAQAEFPVFVEGVKSLCR